MTTILVDPSPERRILDFRKLGFRDVAVLGRYKYTAAHDALEDHTHGNMIEICYLESGDQEYVVENRTYRLTGGDVFVTFPQERHGTGHSPETKGVLFWMLINVPTGRTGFLSLTPTEAHPVLERLLRLPVRQFRANRALKRTLGQIFSSYDRDDDPLRIVNLRNLLLRFVLDMIDASGEPQPGASPMIRQVQRFVEENLDDALSVKQLANLAHLSESRFKARFKAEIGIPPADYVMRRKMRHAKEMLASDRHSITQIAIRLGFNNSQYFATVFKRYTGQTPSAHRRDAVSSGM